MSTAMPWFRMYTDFLNDPKMIALAFEDQRHFIGILALKSDGALDQDCDPDLLDRIVAQRLWIDHAIVRDVKKRLVAARLIDLDWQPIAWGKRQMRSDADSTAAERKRRQREREKQAAREAEQAREEASVNDVTDASRVTAEVVTRLDVDTDTEEETDKEQPHTPAQAQAGEVAPPKAKRSTAKPQAIPLPPWLSADSWAMWDRFRKAKSARAWTHDAKLLSIRELGKLREAGHDPSAVIEQSIQRGWTGLFEIKVPAAAANQSAAQRRSDWGQRLNESIARNTGTAAPQTHDLGVYDATGRPI